MAITIPDVLLEGPVNYHALRVSADGELSWESIASGASDVAVLPDDDEEGPGVPGVLLFTSRTLVFSVQPDGNLRMVIT